MIPMVSKNAWCFVLLVLIITLSAGCIDTTQPGSLHAPEIGSLIDRNSIITIQEKWREYDGDCNETPLFVLAFGDWNGCGYSYYAKLTNGKEYYVDSSLYESLPIYQTGIARGSRMGGFTYKLSEFCPVNVTSYADVRNQVQVIP
jgi:hypothetical protein